MRGRFVRDEATEARFASGEGWEALAGSPRDLISALAVDLEGDGRDELLVNQALRSTARPRETLTGWLARREPANRWALTRLPPTLGTCHAAADLDHDGAVDLVCFGLGMWVVWSPRGNLSGAPTTELPSSGGLIMSIAARDLDEDGLSDLVISNWGPRRSIEVLHNLGARRFEEVSARWGLAADGSNWCVGFVDFDGDGRDDVYVMGDGMNHENYAFRALGPGPEGAPRFVRFRPSRDPATAEDYFGTTNASPMGFALAWIDVDDRPEIIVASDFDRGPGLPILTALTAGDWRVNSSGYGFEREVTDTGALLIPWSPRVWDLDHDGVPEVLVPGGDDEGHARGPQRGTSRVVLYRALSDGRLRDIADAVLPTQGQFMTPALTDLDDDHDLDLVLGGFGQALQVYRNEVEPAGRHTLLRLRGRTSPADPLGARVTVRAAGQTQRFVHGAHAAPQSTEVASLDVAVGAGELESVTVQWPSGYTQELRGVSWSPRLELVEPEILALDPPGRHLPADGTAQLSLTVRPFAADGSPRRARVEIEAPYNPELAWLGPAEELPDGRVRRVLRAPRTAGSAVLVVRLDGVALGVRPRVWFDGPTN